MDFLDFLDDNGWSGEVEDSTGSEEEAEFYSSDANESPGDPSDSNPFPKSEDEDDLLLDIEREDTSAANTGKCAVSKEDAEILSKVRQLKLIPSERGAVDETINKWYRKNFALLPPGFVFRPHGRTDGVMIFGARCIRCSIPPEKNYVFVKDGKGLVKLKHFILSHAETEAKRQRSMAAATQFMMTF